MGYPGRQNIYEAAIRRMVNAALEQQEQTFREAHDADTDAELLAYLNRCAAQLGHSPHPGEIVGSKLIQERFGTWQHALRLAGLPSPPKDLSYQKFARIQEETQRQKEIYRQKKAEKKALAARRRAQQQSKIQK